MAYWKDSNVLQKRINELDAKVIESVGKEQEEIWSALNIQCQTAVGSRCELPLACKLVFLDPIPRSQYLLTHQVLTRIFVDTVDCPSLKPFVSDDETYAKFCSKMYLEAKYLEILNMPVIQRDLFAEMGRLKISN